MKYGKRLAVCLLAGCFAASGTALAEKGERGPKEGKRGKHHEGRRGPPPGERFKAMDADENGSISKSEFQAAHDKRVEKMKERLGDRFDPEKAAERGEAFFARMDADSDGSITKEEMQKGFAGMRGRHHRGGEGGPEGKRGHKKHKGDRGGEGDVN